MRPGKTATHWQSVKEDGRKGHAKTSATAGSVPAPYRVWHRGCLARSRRRCDRTVIKLLSNSIALKGNYFGYISRSGLSPCSTTFGENDPEYSDTIAERTKIACPVDPPVLKARDLGNSQSSFGNTDMDKSFDFESVAPQAAVRFFRWRRCNIEVESRNMALARKR